MTVNFKPEKFLRYFKGTLWLKSNDVEVSLGKLNTRNGGLTRKQKLDAVQAQGKWIKL